MIVAYVGQGMRWTRQRRARRWLQGGINSVSDQAACRRTALLCTVKSCGRDASTLASSLAEVLKARPGRSAGFRKASETRKPATPG